MDEIEFRQKRVLQWFAKGDNDLRNAQIVIAAEQPPTDTICFHCQQAAEKYLKGFLVANGVDFSRVHDLNYLLSLCRQVNEDFAAIVEETSTLTGYAVLARYPLDIPIEYSLEEAQEALLAAQRVVDFVRRRVLTD